MSQTACSHLQNKLYDKSCQPVLVGKKLWHCPPFHAVQNQHLTKHPRNLPTSVCKPEEVITGFNILARHSNVCTSNGQLNCRYSWGNTNNAENRTLQKVILQNQKYVHEQEAETELTQLFVNITDFVFRRAVLLSDINRLSGLKEKCALIFNYQAFE